MATTISSADARVIAEMFLSKLREPKITWSDCEHPGPWPRPQSLHAGHLFYDSEECEIYEFAFLDNNGDDVGFVLVTSNGERGPILDFGVTGNRRSTALLQAVAASEFSGELDAKAIRWRYFGPFDYVAEFAVDDGFVYVRVPNFAVVRSATKITYEAKDIFDPIEDFRRQRYLGTTGIGDPGSPIFDCRILNWFVPVKYNQVCDRYGSGTACGLAPLIDSSSGNYCFPACISGCTAVAWGMLASAYKGSGPDGDLIFPNSPNWREDWETSYLGGPPPRPGDTVVNDAIWQFHSLMGTDCNGSTRQDRAISGKALFDRWGLRWRWNWYENPNYYEAKQPVSVGWPLIIMGHARWDQYASPGGSASVVGHSVVAYGYNDADNHLLVCYGWGSYFQDGWIPFNELSDPAMVYVVRHSP